VSFFNKNFYVGMLAGVALAGFGVVVLVLVAVWIQNQAIGSGRTSFSIAAGSPQPPPFPTGVDTAMTWRLQDLDGNETDLADIPQKVVFVNRWATWCAPCIEEMPSIENLVRELVGEDIAFLIVSDEPVETVAPFVEDKGWRVPIYTAERVPPVFQSSGIPSTFVLDETRRVVFAHVGSALWDAPSSIEYFEGLLR